MMKRFAVAALMAASVLVVGVPQAGAAFQERDIIGEINNSVAVLRFLQRQVKDIREKHDMVRETRLLTEKQLAAQHQLVKEAQDNLAEAKKGLAAVKASVKDDKERAEYFKEEITELEESIRKAQIRIDIFQVGLAKLKRQTEKLAEINLEKTYMERVDVIRKMTDLYEVQLDAKLLEFRVHFGKSPNVNLDFEAKISRFRRKTLGVTYLTIR